MQRSSTHTHTHHRRSCGQSRSCLCKDVSTPTAGSRPPLFFGVRLCVEKTVFRRRTFAPQRKSGGRKPPVGNETSCGLMPTCAGNRSAVHKSGGRKPPVVCSRNANLLTEIPRIAVADAVCEPTAGWRPPLLVAGSLTAGRCSIFAVQCSVHRATAGSHPPLFFGVRWCIAKIVFRRQEFAPQHTSGGRQPP
jgi:hypothetical protein